MTNSIDRNSLEFQKYQLRIAVYDIFWELTTLMYHISASNIVLYCMRVWF